MNLHAFDARVDAEPLSRKEHKWWDEDGTGNSCAGRSRLTGDADSRANFRVTV